MLTNILAATAAVVTVAVVYGALPAAGVVLTLIYFLD
jgi:hypothetical protein